MASKQVIKGRTELLATIYDGDVLASAVITPRSDKTEPFCVHSLRKGNAQVFNDLVSLERANTGKADNGAQDEELEFILYRFFEEFPNQSYECVGCARHDDANEHSIRENDEYCVVTTEDCA